MEEWQRALRSANAPKRFNPWSQIWLHPRLTIQQLVDINPTYRVIPLAMIGGVAEALDRASWRSSGDDLSLGFILGIAIVFGAIGGIVQLYILGALIHWTGRRMGGSAYGEDIRAAMAWSNIPNMWGLLLWIPQILILGEELFTTHTPMLNADPFLAIPLLSFGFLQLVLGIWALVIFLHALGQVQGFSAWKALGNVALSILVIVVPLALLGGLFSLAR